MASLSQQLYDMHHQQFEAWFNAIHPNHDLSFVWVPVWDSGWYKEEMAQGAWIAWLELLQLNKTGIKLGFNPGSTKRNFLHHRSGTAITVEKSPLGVLLTFINKEKASATVLLSTQEEIYQFASAFEGISDINHRECRGFFDCNVVMSLKLTADGEPFEESIDFTFTIADVERPWDGIDLTARLNYERLNAFLETVVEMFDKD